MCLYKSDWDVLLQNLSDKYSLYLRWKGYLRKEAIILVNNENIESNENGVAKTFNDFFPNAAKNLEIPEYEMSR